MKKAGLMAGRPRQRADEARGVWIAVGWFAASLLLFYWIGSRRDPDERAAEARAAAKYKQLDDANKKCVRGLSLLPNIATAQKEELNKIIKDRETIASELESLQERFDDCKHARKLANINYTAIHDTAQAELDRKNAAVQSFRDVLETATKKRGMKYVMLNDFKSRLMRKHERLMKKLDLPIPSGGINEAYVQANLEKWIEIDKRFNETNVTHNGKRVSGPLTSKKGVLFIDDIAASMRKNVTRFNASTLDNDVQAANIFFNEKNSSLKFKLPGWLGQRGNRPIRSGMRRDAVAPESTLIKQLRILNKYALCALGNNVTTFMFPNNFRTCHDNGTCVTHRMTDFIETPLVAFCNDCSPAHTFPVFSVLCAEHDPQRVYDSLLFWRARSRIRFSPAILDIADAFISLTMKPPVAGLREEGKDIHIIAVVLPQRKNVQPGAKRNPSVAYTKVLKGKKYVVERPAPEATGVPSPALVAETLFENVKLLRKTETPFRVFVSCSHLSEEEWQAYKKACATKLPLLSKVMFRYPGEEGHATRNKAIELSIASMSDVLLVGRYDYRSAIAAEGYLLEQRFDPLLPITVF